MNDDKVEEVIQKIESVHFKAPAIQNNSKGWGPCELPNQFKDIPYQPFSKSDRLGKISDWTGASFQDKKFMNKYTSQFGSGSQYSYYHDEDESTFHLVDTTRVQKPLYQRGRFGRNLRMRGGRGGLINQMQQLSKLKSRERERKGQQFKKWGRQQGMRNRNQQQIKIRDASVTVKPSWQTIEEMEFSRLSKLSLPSIKNGEDVLCAGSLEYYDKTYDRVNVKNEKPLQRIDRIFHTVTTTDDPIIRKLSKTDTGNVFATDAILATIMCCTRSNYSWDIVIEKIGDKLFFDKRDNTEFDLLTVNETSIEPPQDDGNILNSPRNLALEATFINHNFSQQVLKSNEPRYKFPVDNPFITDTDEETDVASIAYRYKKWDLNNGIILICRCEHDAVVQGPNGELQFLTIKALNEWDSKLANGVEWRQKLDGQRGAVLANELRNNACKLAKWTIQALLVGSDQIKFGYVSRANVRDSSKHVILGTQQYKPIEFATQINLNMDNAWGILRCIIDICLKQKDGKYLIMKDPNKPMIRLYDIPDNTFDSEEEDDDDDDNEPTANDAFQN
ncbi:hypothetical protein HCN44_002531 [Aphidius gifuensis]|uniref:Eukaryotic translation initiation factor 3 subunit D n=1 Tax=Aphidius gifuensis TaxID=684658 RepID=A0A834Y055_APHGI|nr:eukaryotic translation initiation factor 3 subunit D [Aphidius gifuensis]KAF7996885.1 hypothetical protein HCN44_002531 [Aphidius gifuensis]